MKDLFLSILMSLGLLEWIDKIPHEYFKYFLQILVSVGNIIVYTLYNRKKNK